MSKFLSTLALVINRKTIKENDLLVTFLTPKDGKISALAKGAKSIRSSRGNSLQLGNIVKVHLYDKNNYLWVSEAVTIIPFLQTPKNLSQISLLFYFLEAVNNLVAENQHTDQIFDVCQKTIEAVNQNKLVSFIRNEIKFIEILGFGIPNSIYQSFKDKDYKSTQSQLKLLFESLTEKKFESNRLFK